MVVMLGHVDRRIRRKNSTQNSSPQTSKKERENGKATFHFHIIRHRGDSFNQNAMPFRQRRSCFHDELLFPR
jgi:hypothetical protein